MANTRKKRADATERFQLLTVSLPADKVRYWHQAPTRLGMHRGRSRLIADVLERFGEPYVEGQVTEEAAA